MPIFYAPKEVIELAIILEKTGQEFYARASQTSKSPILKNLFNFLAQEEVNHAKRFERLAKKIISTSYHWDANFDELKLYLKAITDSKFFTSPQSILKVITKVSTPLRLIKNAIQFEKETLLFYSEILNLVRSEDKAVVNKIIAQERSHIKKLNELKESI
jgi:rubrerythrin